MTEAYASESRREARRGAFKVAFFFIWMFSLFLLAILPERWQLVFFWWWLFITGWMLIIWTTVRRASNRRAFSWPTVEGTVRAFTPGSYPRRTKDDLGCMSAVVQYEYTVDGKVYLGGDTLAVFTGTGTHEGAYKPGQTILLCYDPKKPWKSRAATSMVTPMPSVAVTVMGVVIVILCLAAAISELRKLGWW